MKKRTKLKIGTIMIMSLLLAGCADGAGETKTSAPESTAESTGDITTKADGSAASEGETDLDDKMISTGVLDDILEDLDSAGNRGASFKGSDGNDFIAIISEDTILPEELVVGRSYDVSHSAVSTRSLPPQYPNVYEISEASGETSGSGAVSE